MKVLLQPSSMQFLEILAVGSYFTASWTLVQTAGTLELWRESACTYWHLGGQNSYGWSAFRLQSTETCICNNHMAM